MNGKIKVMMVAMVIFSLVGLASAAPNIDICTTNPAVCASNTNTLVVYQGVLASSNPGLYAHFVDWIISPATPGSIWVVDTVVHDGNPANTVDYGPVAVSIDTDPKDALYGWTPDGIGDLRYKIYASAFQDNETFFADVTVRARVDAVPELPTSALMSVGLIGLFGMVYLRRKN
jgi:hypothetical protein